MQRSVPLLCTFLAAAVFAIGVILTLTGRLSGCQQTEEKPAAVAQVLDALPFTVPEQFTYDASVSQRYGMPGYRSEYGNTLILSCHPSTEQRFLSAQQETVTCRSLEQAFADRDVSVTVTGLEDHSSGNAVIYTYWVQLTNQYGTTVTRKYTRVTADQYLDISCGGDADRVRTVTEDFAAVMRAIDH